jgi:NADH-quinone oxidoreductase subunit I
MADELIPRTDEFGLAKSDAAKAPITKHESSSLGMQLIGFWVKFKTMFKKVNNVQYTEV